MTERTVSPMVFEIISIFPSMFRGVLEESIIRRAIENRIIEVDLVNLRDYAEDKHATVDDTIYGGIPGMLMRCDPLFKAIRSIREKHKPRAPRVIYLSPRGSLLTHQKAVELSQQQCLILLCGRYKGIDQRVIDALVDEEISIGDYVVSGGELPAMVLLDALTRLRPGALGDRESAQSDSHADGLLEAGNYTRPEVYEGSRVPDVLLSGHHKKIEEWRTQQQLALTRDRRPDLYKKWQEQAGQ